MKVLLLCNDTSYLKEIKLFEILQCFPLICAGCDIYEVTLIINTGKR